jgi:ADP-ribose pyrophosphatase YjhB (NUDIX family)
MELSLVFLACANDRSHLDRSTLVPEAPDEEGGFSVVQLWSDTIARRRSRMTAYAICCPGGDIPRSASEERLQQAVRAGNPIFVFIEGYKSENCEGCARLRRLVAREVRKSNRPVVVLQTASRLLREPFWHLKPAIVPQASARTVGDVVNDDSELARVAQKTKRDFRNTILGIIENLGNRPVVGVGVLLVRADGKFLLTRRLRPPGVGRLGTFGGNLAAGAAVDKALLRLAKDELGLNRDHVELGPLLACTNMVEEDFHYVDLTFFAKASAKCNPRIRDEARHEYVDADSNPWFDFERVRRFHDDGELFVPVGNAFERFCMLSLMGLASRGVAQRFQLALGAGAFGQEGPSPKDFDFPWMPPASELLRLCHDGSLGAGEVSPLFFDHWNVR